MSITWFLFDLGNTLIKLDYERVMARICRDANVDRDALLEIFEQPGGYRDLERGASTFPEFFDFLRDRAGFRGSLREFREIWSDFFAGPVPGMEELLDRVREKYRVAFLSNSNEIHADVIPHQFPSLFRVEDRFIYSYRHKLAKPDMEMFQRALDVLGALPEHTVFIDDLLENVISARQVGMKAFQFTDTPTLIRALEAEQLLAKR